MTPATHRDFTPRLGGRGVRSALPGFLLWQKSKDGAFQSPWLCSSWSPSPQSVTKMAAVLGVGPAALPGTPD